MMPDVTISIFGLGYVGTTTAACLSQRGFRVVGVDVNSTKVEMVNAGQAPVVEESIAEIVRRNVASGRLTATEDVDHAIDSSDVSLICVGTPSLPNGDTDLRYVKRVAEQIGQALAGKSEYHSVILRSTVPPGTTEQVVRPIIETASTKATGEEIGLAFNPEFLREGSSVRDFHSPPFTLVGAATAREIDVVRTLFGWIDAEFVVVDIRTAEMIKYVNNCFHATKVAFANEVGRLCAALKLDSHEVMNVVCKDTKQNLSPEYLKPGFAFGGSCLPKDLRAIISKARSLDVPVELFQGMLKSNESQIQKSATLVQRIGHRRVGVLGLAFKAGTDDLRESPLVALVELLHERGFQVSIYDKHVSLSRLIGTNKTYIELELPHLADMLCDSIDDVLANSDTVVIGNADPDFAAVVEQAPPEKAIVDLVRITPDWIQSDNYHGLGW